MSTGDRAEVGLFRRRLGRAVWRVGERSRARLEDHLTGDLTGYALGKGPDKKRHFTRHMT